jgi:putative oxidoreductase
MFRKLIHTSGDPTLTLLRAVLGVVFFAHGAQKALGWFGGSGFSGTMDMFTQNMHIPSFLAALVILAEFLGGIGLVVGLFARVAASGIAVVMLVAILMVHLPNGLFMNWTGAKAGEGFEFHLFALAISIAVMIRGAGELSMDRVLERSITGGRRMHIPLEPHPSRG